MIKLIPIIIFPLSFFIIFLGVKNLTGNFPFNKENIDHNNKEEIVKPDQDSEKIEEKTVAELEKNLINNEQQSIDVDKNFKSTDEKEKKIIKGENVNESFFKIGLPSKDLLTSFTSKIGLSFLNLRILKPFFILNLY